MPNLRNNYIPVPTKPARSVLKPRVVTQRKTCGSQTERVVLIKEENLKLSSSFRLGQNDGGMRRDYNKAINYVNGCHKFINTIIEKNAIDKDNIFQLPMFTNFAPIFHQLMGKKLTKCREKQKIVLAEESVKKSRSDVRKSRTDDRKSKSDERKSKSSFGVKKTPQVPIDTLSVGDCGKNVQIHNNPDTNDVVSFLVSEFMSYLKNGQNEKCRWTEVHETKTVNIVIETSDEVRELCLTSSKQELGMNVREIPEHPPLSQRLETDSIIPSDTEWENSCSKPQSPLHTPVKSTSSIISDSSDIKSDSDLDIHL